MTRVVHFSTKSYHKYLKQKIPTSNYTNWIKSKIEFKLNLKLISFFSSTCIGLCCLPCCVIHIFKFWLWGIRSVARLHLTLRKFRVAEFETFEGQILALYFWESLQSYRRRLALAEHNNISLMTPHYTTPYGPEFFEKYFSKFSREQADICLLPEKSWYKLSWTL